jgi:TRAP-type mannitol/chloroaromatic compound transport system permease large subunit
MGEAQFQILDRQNQQILKELATLTAAVATLTASTTGVVAAYNNMLGAIRVGMALQSFALWLMKWGAIGAGVAAMIYWALDLPPPGSSL